MKRKFPFQIKKKWLKYIVLFKIFKWAITLIISYGLLSCHNYGEEEVVSEDYTLYLPSDASFDNLKDSISHILINESAFWDYSNKKKLNRNIRSGRYDLKKGMTAKEVVGKILRGEQDQHKLVIKNHRTLHEMIGHVSKQIEADSAELFNSFSKYDFGDGKTNDLESAKQYFQPNTYFVWWDMKPEAFFNKMKAQFDQFWDENRIIKAKSLQLTINEATILASLVQLEASVSKQEQKKVAKAYLNRLEKGMKLEADPTAVYGYSLVHGFDPVYRVYNYHIHFDSDYNTYLREGLPPSPICLPNSTAIDAVLEPAEHDFIYFCAKPDNSGTHNFTNSYSQHKRNARAYRRWLTQRNIR